jgi:hypothetical protein
MRVIAVVADAVEKLVVEVADVRRVVRCSWCGFKTARVHDSPVSGSGISRLMAGPPRWCGSVAASPVPIVGSGSSRTIPRSSSVVVRM